MQIWWYIHNLDGGGKENWDLNSRPSVNVRSRVHNTSIEEYFNSGDDAYEVISIKQTRLKDKVKHFSTYDVIQNLSSESVRFLVYKLTYEFRTRIITDIIVLSMLKIAVMG